MARRLLSLWFQNSFRGLGEGMNLEYVMEYGSDMAPELKELLASVKHPTFHEEREWRIVAGFEFTGRHLRFRSTEIAIVPYVEVPLPPSLIRSIRIGPGRHVDLREAGLRRLLNHLECDVPVSRSQVPLRR